MLRAAGCQMEMPFARNWALIAAVIVVAGLYSFHECYANEAPRWKRADPGTQAFLGDDGGGVNTATVCDTADRYRDWLRYKHPRGCQTFQHDLPVVIEVVTLDRAIDNVGGVYRPIAKIRISSRNFTGYVSLLGLHPVIPSGVIVRYKRLGNDRLLATVERLRSDRSRKQSYFEGREARCQKRRARFDP